MERAASWRGHFKVLCSDTLSYSDHPFYKQHRCLWSSLVWNWNAIKCSQWNSSWVYVISRRSIISYKSFGGCSELWYPKAALSPPFRAPAELGQGIMIISSCAYMSINSGMQTFREPFAAVSRPFRGLAPLQQNTHTHTSISADVTLLMFLDLVIQKFDFSWFFDFIQWNVCPNLPRMSVYKMDNLPDVSGFRVANIGLFMIFPFCTPICGVNLGFFWLSFGYLLTVFL